MRSKFGRCWTIKIPTRRPTCWHPLLRWKPMKRLRPRRWWERCQCQWEPGCCDAAMSCACGTGLLCSTNGYDGISEELMLSGNSMNNHKGFMDYHKNFLNHQGLQVYQCWNGNQVMASQLKGSKLDVLNSPRGSSRLSWTFCCSSWWQVWQSRTWKSPKRTVWSSWRIWSSKGLSWW